jgi:hypothetical protein
MQRLRLTAFVLAAGLYLVLTLDLAFPQVESLYIKSMMSYSVGKVVSTTYHGWNFNVCLPL